MQWNVKKYQAKKKLRREESKRKQKALYEMTEMWRNAILYVMKISIQRKLCGLSAINENNVSCEKCNLYPVVAVAEIFLTEVREMTVL